MASTLRGSASRPTTSWPSSAKATASGSPTYPRPTPPTLMGGSVGRGLLAAGCGLATPSRLPDADQVVDEQPAGGGRRHQLEAVWVDGGQVPDHGGGGRPRTGRGAGV